MYSELEVCGGSVPDSCRERSDILNEGITGLPPRSQVMSAAGRLPLWMQNSCSGSPSSTVVESGATRKESIIAAFKK